MADDPLVADTAPDAAAWTVEELGALNGERPGPWLQFLDVPSMFAGIYEIPAGGEDRQSPHDADELYYVAKGRGTLVVGDGETERRIIAEPGSLLFVRADVPHRFVDVTEDLQVIVFFSKAESQ